MDRYSFIVMDLHHLLLAGLPAHLTHLASPLQHGSREIAVLIATSTVLAVGGARPPTMPSANSCAAVGPPCDGLSPLVAAT